MASLTLKYTTEAKYNALTDEEKATAGYLYFVKGTNYDALYSNNRCYGKVPKSGEMLSYVTINSVMDLPTIGKPNTMYICESGGMYMWNDETLGYYSPTEWDIISGGNSIS